MEFTTVKLVNKCPHLITIVDDEANPIVALEPKGTPARVSQTEVVLEVSGFPCKVTKQVFGQVEDLPEPAPGVAFVVSRLVAAACPERKDLVIPGPLVRDESGNPVGCRGLSIL